MTPLSDFDIGDRVELHPATDLWMRGARFGRVVGIGRKYLSIRLDYGQTVARVTPQNVTLLQPILPDWAIRTR